MRVLGVFGGHVQQLADAVEAGERLGDLGADRGDRDERRRHEADEEDVHDEVAERHFAREDGAAAQADHQHADDAHHHRAAGRGRGYPGHGLGDVTEQLVRALGEHNLLALLGGVRLDTRIPPSASVSRPVTSALILPRSRNSGAAS
jgi:hypothetical protein